MPNTLLIKNRGGAGVVPASLSVGELAINTTDRRLFAGTDAGVELLSPIQQLVFLTADAVQIKGTSFQTVPEFTVTLKNSNNTNTTWVLVYDLAILMSTTTGTFGLSFQSNAGGIAGYFGVQGLSGAPNTAAGTPKNAISSIGTGIANSVFGNTGSTALVTWARLQAAIRIPTAQSGVVSLQVATSGASIGATIKAGSYMRAYLCAQ